MSNRKTTIEMICAAWAVALPVMTFAASVLQNAQAANWILRNVENGASLTAADWRELEKEA